jgi:membrane protein DedA with SNARE-associated domain
VGLERLAELVLDPGIPPLAIYTTVFLSCVLEAFFPPWPTDVISIYAGFLAGRGQLSRGLVLGTAVAGTQVGVMTTFWLGRHWGHALLAGPFGRLLHAERLASLARWFDRYGAAAIAISRFFPGIRALVTPAAGLAGFPAWKVLWWAGLSVIVWNMLVVGLGVLAGTHLEWARQILVRYNIVAGVVLLVAGFGGGLVLFCRCRSRRSVSP